MGEYISPPSERDPETGNDNFGARYYTSSLGRFMTPDWDAKPVTVPYATFGDPQTLNLYSYVENAPLNRVDADGHATSVGGQVASIIVGPDSNPNNPGEANCIGVRNCTEEYLLVKFQGSSVESVLEQETEEKVAVQAMLAEAPQALENCMYCDGDEEQTKQTPAQQTQTSGAVGVMGLRALARASIGFTEGGELVPPQVLSNLGREMLLEP